jgi:hypothetical protein
MKYIFGKQRPNLLKQILMNIFNGWNLSVGKEWGAPLWLDRNG